MAHWCRMAAIAAYTFLLGGCHSQSSSSLDVQSNSAEALRPFDEELNLDPIFTFEDAANCTTGPALTSIFGDLLKLLSRHPAQATRARLSIPGIEGTFTSSVSRPSRPNSSEAVETGIALSGRWHRLHVTGLSVSAVPESDLISQQIRFASPAAEVRATLNRQGFNLRPVGEWRETNAGSETPGSMGVEAVGSGSILNCQ